MSQPLIFKSKLIKEYDPKQTDVSQFKIPLKVDQSLYERDLLNFRRRFALCEEASDVQKNDMATISCNSALPRFNKNSVTIRIGMGLFSRELEDQITGWKVGQSGTVTVKEQEVSVTVESAKREVLPEITDELALRCGDPNIKTAEDIFAYCKGKQFDEVLEEPLDEAFTYLSRIVFEECEFDIDEEELTAARERMVSEFAGHSAIAGRNLDDVPDEEFEEMFSCTKEEITESMKMSGEYILKAAVLGQVMLERAGKLYTEDDYENYINRCMNANGKSEEEVRSERTVFGFILDNYGDYCMNELEALALRKLKEGIE